MTPGFLHFDVRSGLKSNMLNGALFGLLGDKQCIIDALLSIGFSDIEITSSMGLKIKACPPANFDGQIKEIKDLFSHKKVAVSISSLALEVLDNLCLENITKHEAIEIICELSALCSQVAKLDPKFISSS